MATPSHQVGIEAQLRQACAELERRLHAGEECSARRLLDESANLAVDSDAAQELIYTEFVIRQERGEEPQPQTWLEQFPEWRADLQKLFQVHELLGEEAIDTPRPSLTPATFEAGVQRRIQPGQRIGQYELIEEIDRGGMGVVYRARQRGLNRTVALKMILSPHAGLRDQARFSLEAEAVARLQHPNIVQVYEVGSDDGCPYLAMEFVDGPSLEQRLADGPLLPRTAAELVATLARAVQHAHEHGIVHRDLKPANILLSGVSSQDSGVRIQESEASRLGSALTPDPRPLTPIPKITDFGLAKQLPRGDGSDVPDDVLTQSGAMLGTPRYMAPEQANAKHDQIGPATDVYALGVILYETLTARVPFQAATPLETLEQVRSQDPLPPSRLLPRLPRDLETICLKCLEKEPRRRYPDAAGLAADLARFLAGEPIVARPASLPERTTKWVKRRPGLAASIAIIVTVTAVGFAGVTSQWFRAEASRGETLVALDKAEAARDAELAERERVEKLLYANDIALAHHEYLTHNTVRANQILERCRQDLRHWEWNYLNGLCHAESLVLTGHSMGVISLAYSPDGKLIAAGSGRGNLPDPGEVKVWDARTGKELFTFRAQRGSIPSLAFSPDSRRLAAICLRERWGVSVWDLEDGTELLWIDAPRAFRVAFSRDPGAPGLLAVGFTDGPVKLFDSASGQLVRSLDGHQGSVQSVAFHPDGIRLASGSRDGVARIWDATDGRELVVHRGLDDVRVVAFSPDGKQFLAAMWNGTIKIWDIETGVEIGTHQGKSGDYYVAFSPDGKSLAHRTSERGVQIWKMTDRALTRTFPADFGGWLEVAFSPDGTRLASGGYDRAVRVWDMTSELNPRVLEATGGAHVADTAYSPDGKYLAVVATINIANPSRESNDKSLRIWDMAARRARVCQGHTDWLTSVSFSADGQQIATSSLDKTVRVWDAKSGETLRVLEGHTGAVATVSFSPDGIRLVSGSSDGSLRLWDVKTGEPLRAWQGHEGGITCAVFAPGGETIASSGKDNHVRIWNSMTAEQAVSLSGDAAADNLAFSPDGRLLASPGADGLIYVWELAAIVQQPEPKPVYALQGHTHRVTGLSFSPDGKRLASIAWDQCVRLWDVASGQEVISIRSNATDFSRVRFSPDGRFLAASYSIYVSVWDSAGKRPELEETRAELERAQVSAWHERAAQDAEQERQWFAAAFHLSRVIEAHPDRRANYLRRLGHAYSQLDRTTDAMARYELALQVDPEGASAYNSLAWLLATCPDMAQRDPNRAVELARQAVKHQWSNASYRNTLAAALYRQGKWSDALAALETAMALGDGGDSLDWFVLAMVVWQQGDQPTARYWLARAIERMQQNKPDDRTLLRFRAEADALIGTAPPTDPSPISPADPSASEPLWSRVVAGYSRLIAEQPTVWWLFDQRAYAHSKLGQWRDCAADFASAFELNSKFVELWFVQAGALLMANDNEGYEQLCPQTLPQLSTMAGHRNRYLAARICLLAPNEVTDAQRLISLAEEAVEGIPSAGHYRHVLGLAQYRAGQFDEAVRNLQRSMESVPKWTGHVCNWFALALAHHRLGQADVARQWFNKAETWMQQTMGDAPFKSSDFKLHPHDWLAAHLLWREAKSVLDAGTGAQIPPVDNPG